MTNLGNPLKAKSIVEDRNRNMDLRPNVPTPPSRTPHRRVVSRPGRPLPAKVLARILARVPARDALHLRGVDSWVFTHDNPPLTNPTFSDANTIAQVGIASWLRRPSEMLPGSATPFASLRLVCCRQQVSTISPFDEVTSKAIHGVLGIPEGHDYLTKLKAGSCGKYSAGPEQQGK